MEDKKDIIIEKFKKDTEKLWKNLKKKKQECIYTIWVLEQDIAY